MINISILFKINLLLTNKTMSDYPHIRNFITREIGGNEVSVLRSILFDIEESTADGESIGVYQMKRIIWFSADWPLFVEPDISVLQNQLDDIIDNHLAFDLMHAIEMDDPEYRFDDETNELVRLPIPREKLF